MRAARTVKAPVVSPAWSAGAVATPELLVRAVATFSPPVKAASVSPTIVKRIRTLATPLPAAFSALVLICSVNASPAMAVSFAVPESSRWSTDWVGVGGVDGAGGGGGPHAGGGGGGGGGGGAPGRGGGGRGRGGVRRVGRARLRRVRRRGRRRRGVRATGATVAAAAVAAVAWNRAGAVGDLVGALAVVLQPR